MKIGVVKSDSMDKIYGKKYDDKFFDELWRKNLIDKLSPQDHVEWLKFEELRDFDKGAKDYDAIIGAWIVDDMLSDEVLSRHKNLKYVSTLAHGFGRIDSKVCKEHGLTVTNTIYGDVTIAQYAMALLLDICHDISKNDDYYRHKKWLSENHERRMITPQIELYQKTFGIIGLGNIGYSAAKMASGFGMKVIAYSRHKKEDEKYSFIEQVGFDELLERSDVISIHCPLTDSTKNLLDKAAFDRMKEGVILINTARGAIIDEKALVDALKSKKVYAAGLDVVTGEPLDKPCELMSCDNTKITEHIAWLPVESRVRCIKTACENFLNWKNGTPTSVVV